MNAHFFDIETILVMYSKVWIVDKTNPKVPLMKLSVSDFNLIKSGIYRNQNNSIYFGGKTYWIPEDLMNSIKIKCKKFKVDVTNLAFSMQEFMNPDIIDTLDYDLNLENISHLKNTNDDIYIICSENTKVNYEKIIKKIEDKLEDIGLIIKKYYFISETFYSKDQDDISYKKVRLLLQHLIGKKTEGDKFIGEDVHEYDNIHFYDNDQNTIKLLEKSNNILQNIIDNSEESIKSELKEKLKQGKCVYSNLVSPNKVNKFSTKKIDMNYNLIKTFEKFNWKK